MQKISGFIQGGEVVGLCQEGYTAQKDLPNQIAGDLLTYLSADCTVCTYPVLPPEPLQPLKIA